MAASARRPALPASWREDKGAAAAAEEEEEEEEEEEGINVSKRGGRTRDGVGGERLEEGGHAASRVRRGAP